ncbi:helix-turn-helix transcriptional regulator [Hymenobacter sp. 15J16-1T3B]|uniref:winged helix-turn-helix transcriptional regulator n=1 Tax=Hymenobacter sp. 15J16-1T3B TaxID=2886941 RepID=UPI001D118779|nr:helix-turn-helix domain-containing protein [Hymenobacter sp. 15J16-1T3B]MCC3159599.1 helix-turn-helix transcriptional regulator [Hymenobacter sp. 15J16-1T3B]
MRTAIELLGGKWRLLILQQVASGARRYSQLRQVLPDISEKVLAQELKNLVDADLLRRQEQGPGPARVEYELTEAGRQALPVLAALLTFGLGYAASQAGPPPGAD